MCADVVVDSLFFWLLLFISSDRPNVPAVVTLMCLAEMIAKIQLDLFMYVRVRHRRMTCGT